MELKDIAEINNRNLAVIRKDLFAAIAGSVVINLAIHWVFL